MTAVRWNILTLTVFILVVKPEKLSNVDNGYYGLKELEQMINVILKGYLYPEFIYLNNIIYRLALR